LWCTLHLAHSLPYALNSLTQVNNQWTNVDETGIMHLVKKRCTWKGKMLLHEENTRLTYKEFFFGFVQGHIFHMQCMLWRKTVSIWLSVMRSCTRIVSFHTWTLIFQQLGQNRERSMPKKKKKKKERCTVFKTTTRSPKFWNHEKKSCNFLSNWMQQHLLSLRIGYWIF